MNQTLRHIASIVLLATYLPMVIQSSLHIHHETIDELDKCLECAGHFETNHHHQHDCQFCHFLNLNYIVQTSEQSTFTFLSTDRLHTSNVEQIEIQHYGVSLLRAPPTA